MSDVSLRTYAFIDRLQPQCAAHIAATCQGDVPLAGNAELFIEMAPGNEVFHIADVALKAADVKPALQIVEREFGLLELHSNSQAEVLAAGASVLAANEAEKSADIAVVEIRAVGRFGRVFLSGSESDVSHAREAAIAGLTG